MLCNNRYFLRTRFSAAAKTILLIVLAVGCTTDKKKIDVKDVELTLTIKRFEQDLFKFNPANSSQYLESLQNKYGSFFSQFNEKIINIGPANNPSYPSNLQGFINDQEIKTVYGDVQQEFGSFEEEKEELTVAFKRYHRLFPTKRIPEIITFLSGFNYAMVPFDSTLAIGLDMYLGTNYKFYEMLPQIPRYAVLHMRPEYVVPDAVKAWVITRFQNDSLKPELLNDIIHEGKMLYVLDLLLPETPDSLKIGYTKNQLKWINDNEKNVWAFFIDKKLLFSTNPIINNKYLSEGPFTPGMPKESPPKAGVWIGWQIIRSYMENNEVTVEQLINQKDAQLILRNSKYKPGK